MLPQGFHWPRNPLSDEASQARDSILVDLHMEKPDFYDHYGDDLEADLDEYLLCQAKNCNLSPAEYELYTHRQMIGPRFAPQGITYMPYSQDIWATDLNEARAYGYPC